MEKNSMIDFAKKIRDAEQGKTHLFSVGQAGYIIKNEKGQLLGIDLYLSECVEEYEGHMGFKRLLPNLLEPLELKFDSIIATHAHLDHFDRKTIPKIIINGKGKTHLYATMNCRKEVKGLHIAEEYVTYIMAGDRYIAGDYIVDFVSCDHGEAAPDAVGLIITMDRKKIYVTGDTCLRLDWIEKFKKRGPFDIMIAPINGAYGNMDEQDCAILSDVLMPKLTIPSHYGMFAAHGGNPGLFIEKMKEICPQNQYFLMAPGEDFVL